MVREENILVMDIDGTLCEIKPKGKEYIDVEPLHDMVEKLKEYREKGFYIILNTSRQMRTHEGNLGRINANTAKTLFEWLDKYDIPYDEIYFGKPWCGRNGFYVDDKCVRPKEFREKSFEELNQLLIKDR